MASITTTVGALLRAAIASFTAGRAVEAALVVPVVESSDGSVTNLQGNEDGHALVELSGGTVTATVDTSALATQATLAAVLAALGTPSTHTAITKSDTTDLTAIANFGVYIGGAGDLVYRTAGAPSTTVTLAVVAGQFVYGQFTRVMAATTATGIVGVAR